MIQHILIAMQYIFKKKIENQTVKHIHMNIPFIIKIIQNNGTIKSKNIN